jgi:hypothetical protein
MGQYSCSFGCPRIAQLFSQIFEIPLCPLHYGFIRKDSVRFVCHLFAICVLLNQFRDNRFPGNYIDQADVINVDKYPSGKVCKWRHLRMN